MTTTIPSVTPYPLPAPQREDRVNFRDRADSKVAHDVVLVGVSGGATGQLNLTLAAMNTVAGECESFNEDAETAKTAAETAETNAETARDFSQEWAKKSATSGKVNDGVNTQDYSAKAYAVDDLTGANGGSAKDWAQKAENVEVISGEYSAKHWAQKTAQGERFTATSSTTVTIGTGSRTFTLTEAYRSFIAGSKVRISQTSNPSVNYMTGIVTSCNVSTNVLIVNVTAIGGSGTISGWSIGLSAGGDADSINGYSDTALLDMDNWAQKGALDKQSPVWSTSLGKWLPGATDNLIVESRTSNTILGVADLNKIINITSGTFTQTFTAASTVGNGWFCYIKNSGTGNITLDPNSSELIDGLTSFIMYPGEMRLIQCNGTAFNSFVMKSFYTTFISSGTFVKPPGYTAFHLRLYGGGASGEVKYGTTSARSGAGGGTSEYTVYNSEIPNTTSYIIGSGGVGSLVSGGDTSFGDPVILKTYGAGGSVGGNSLIFVISSATAIYQQPYIGRTFNSDSTGAYLALYAGGSGGSGSEYTQSVGGNSIFGAAGGGASMSSAGQSGGVTGQFVDSNSSAGAATAGVNGSASNLYGGYGGGGNHNGNAGAGGFPGGGGGGCSYESGGPFTSGPGGNGCIRMWGIV